MNQNSGLEPAMQMKDSSMAKIENYDAFGRVLNLYQSI